MYINDMESSTRERLESTSTEICMTKFQLISCDPPDEIGTHGKEEQIADSLFPSFNIQVQFNILVKINGRHLKSTKSQILFLRRLS
ncbi:hypothetical protein CDAR_575741 [Caerostris darwini]|uniref:Uncharacterized protein n=1 Tax=Caerostris darwini TaxID=1538125 RepID=A0AAV4XAC0_9ARAC|nr:hypothetical protein CDAR_575741 [Caerostris darwini]